MSKTSRATSAQIVAPPELWTGKVQAINAIDRTLDVVRDDGSVLPAVPYPNLTYPSPHILDVVWMWHQGGVTRVIAAYLPSLPPVP